MNPKTKGGDCTELFKLLGTIAVDNATANQNIDETSEKANSAGNSLKSFADDGEKSGGKISKVFKVVGSGAAIMGKAIAKAVTVGAGAMAGLTVKAIKLGGELEQNMGGSEAVFKEYADGMQTTAQEAFKNMGLSTSDYLATANKMGALFQGAGFGIEQSADISAQAMQRAADVASIMGISTESAMEAIAGAAKGNFTMMDNLGVAMNDTTLQAYALATGIQKSTSEMTNQEKIGLAMQMFLEKTEYAAGNYAKENETLAGSLSTAKAALTNFLDGSGDVDSLADSFVNASNVIIKNLNKLLPRLVKGISDIIKKLMPQLPPLLQSLLPGILDGAIQLLNGLMDALPMVIDILTGMLPDLIDCTLNILIALIDAIITALPTVLPALLDGVFKLISGIMMALPTIIQMIVSILPELILNLVNALIENLPILIDGCIQLTIGIVQALPQIILGLIEAIPTIISTIVEGLWNALPIIIEGIVSIVGNIITALWKCMTNFYAPLGEFLSGVWGSISDAFSSIGTWVYDTIISPVTNFCNNLWDGIVSGCKNLWSNIVSIFNKVSSWFDKNIATPIKNIFSNAWKNMKNGASDAWNGIKNVFGSVANWFKNIFSNAWQGVKNVFSTGGKIFDGIKDGIVKAFKTVVNGIIRGINKVVKIPFDGINWALESIKNVDILGIRPFDWINTINVPQIPELAEGGVLKKGQVGLLEGTGAEAVVPLEKNTKWVKQVAAHFDNDGAIGNNAEIIVLLKAILTVIERIDKNLYNVIVSALTDGVELEWNNREIARMVKKYV